jgi:hypothetical protein
MRYFFLWAGDFYRLVYLLQEILGVLFVLTSRSASDRGKHLQEPRNFDYTQKVLVRVFFHEIANLGESGKRFPLFAGLPSGLTY